MAQRAGRANEGVDHAAVPRMKRCCIVCVWHRPDLRGTGQKRQSRHQKRVVTGLFWWIEGTLEADGGQQDEVIATLWCGRLTVAIFRWHCVLVRMCPSQPHHAG